MSGFHFLRPGWLYLLPLLAMFLLWLRYRRHARSHWESICDPQLRPHVLVGESDRIRSWPLLAIGAAATLGLIALAGPAWQKLPQPLYQTESSLVIALDVSASMDAEDVKPSRLARARHKIRDILERRRDGSTGLVAYAGDAFAVTPLTTDAGTVSSLLQALSSELMPAPGSRADRALDLSRQLLKQAGFANGDILLVTDTVPLEQTAEAAAALRADGYRVSVLGVGTEQGAPIPARGGGFIKDKDGAIVLPKLDPGSLSAVATEGGGRYRHLSADDNDIDELLSATTPGMNQTQDTELTADQWREEGPWLLLLILPLAALAFRRGYLLALVFLLPLPGPADALDWASLWLNPDQQGQSALQQGDPQRAAELFEDRRWRAAAHYRAGDYGLAAADLEGAETSDDWYNRGNALARLGDFQNASEAYREALRLDPGNQDAEYNLRLLQQLQEQARDQSSEDEQSSEDNQPQNKSGENSGGDNGQTRPPDSDGVRTGDSKPDDSADARQPQSESGNPDAGAGEEDADRPRSQGNPEDGETGSAKAEDTADPLGAAHASEEQTGQNPNATALGADESLSAEQRENEQAVEQWLRRVPDDPGGLLRRKFLYQYRQRQRSVESEPW